MARAVWRLLRVERDMIRQPSRAKQEQTMCYIIMVRACAGPLQQWGPLGYDERPLADWNSLKQENLSMENIPPVSLLTNFHSLKYDVLALAILRSF